MKIGSFVSATIGYVVVTFLLAVAWHVALFKSTYEQLGYFGKDPSFALGLLSILTQGLVLAYLFPLFSKGENPYREGLRFSLVMGGVSGAAMFWGPQQSRLFLPSLHSY